MQRDYNLPVSQLIGPFIKLSRLTTGVTSRLNRKTLGISASWIVISGTKPTNRASSLHNAIKAALISVSAARVTARHPAEQLRGIMRDSHHQRLFKLFNQASKQDYQGISLVVIAELLVEMTSRFNACQFQSKVGRG